MDKVKTGTGPAAFHTTFKIQYPSYPTRFSNVNYSRPKNSLRKSAIMVIIFRDFLVFNQIFISPQVKRSVVISNKYTNCLTSWQTT